jgi:hypothetical protein
MRDINDLNEDEQIEYISSDVFYYINYTIYSIPKYFNKTIKDIDNCIVVEDYYVSLKPQSTIFDINSKLPFFFIDNILNPSEKVQIEVVKNLDYNDTNNDNLVEEYIKSKKAIKMYYKNKIMHNIIK